MIRVRLYQIGRWPMPYFDGEEPAPGLPFLVVLHLSQADLEAWLEVVEPQVFGAVREMVDQN